MSLISEALKKARVESREGSRLPLHGHRDLPRPRRSFVPWLVAAVSLSLAVGIVTGVILLQPEGPAPATESVAVPVPESLSAPEPAPAPVPASLSTPVPVPEPVTESRSTPVPEPVPVPLPESAASSPLPQERPDSEGEGAASSTGSGPPASEAATSPASGRGWATVGGGGIPAEGAVYRQRVALPGGGEIHLRGIAWHATEPSALLNDRVLAPGEGLDDWTLAGIEKGQVEIEWRGVRFLLRVK